MIVPTLANDDAVIVIPVMFIIFVCVTIMVGMVSYNRRRSNEVASREETKREVAAYVAEGTMTSEDAARILADGRRGVRMTNFANMGTMSPMSPMSPMSSMSPGPGHEMPAAWKEWLDRTSHKARAAAAAFRQSQPNGTPPGPGWQWVGEGQRAR